jgi:hypothetical protein
VHGWCGRIAGDRGQRGHVTKGRDKCNSTFFCPGRKPAKKEVKVRLGACAWEKNGDRLG